MSKDEAKIVTSYGYHHNSGEPCITVRDEDHTPYNKRPGSCKSVVDLEVATHRTGGWTNIKLEERTTNHNWDTKKDTTQTRTISFTIDKAIADKVALVMRGQHHGKAKPGDVAMPMTKVAIQTLNKRGKAIMEIMQAVRANRTKKKMKPSELAMTLASYQMELDALNLAISALEEKL